MHFKSNQIYIIFQWIIRYNKYTFNNVNISEVNIKLNTTRNNFRVWIWIKLGIFEPSYKI